MIRIPFERDRLSHGHLVHPIELAHLVHYWDNRKLIERDQRKALEACSTELRKMAPLVEELVNMTRPDHPLQHLAPNITSMHACQATPRSGHQDCCHEPGLCIYTHTLYSI